MLMVFVVMSVHGSHTLALLPGLSPLWLLFDYMEQDGKGIAINTMSLP